MQITLHNESYTAKLAQILAPQLKIGDTLLLKGDLGAGKTCFARALIQSLTNQRTTVSSPTFNILQTYDTSQGTIYHFDFYRLESPEELVETGIDEALQLGICVIEWPQIMENEFPENWLLLSFTKPQSSRSADSRVVTLTAKGSRWHACLKTLHLEAFS